VDGDDEQTLFFDTTRLGKHLTRRMSALGHLSVSTGETLASEDAGRISIAPPVISGLVIIAAFALAVGLQEGLASHAGVSYWSVLSDTHLPKKLAVPAYSDATAWFLVLAISLLPFLYVRLCRQIEVLLNVGTIEHMAPQRSEDFRDRCRQWQTRFGRVSRRSGNGILTVVSGVLSFVALLLAFRIGPVRGLLRAALAPTKHWQLQTNWWLDPWHEPFVSGVFWLILSVAIFVLAKQLFLLTATYRLFDYLRQIDVKATIDLRNSDGHYGLEPFRQFLKSIFILGVVWILITSTILFVWIGPNPATVSMGIVATAICIGALALPMALIADSIRKGKGDCLALVENHEHVIEASVHERLMSWSSTAATTGQETSDDTLIITYWQLLQAQHENVLNIPSTGFRYREFLYSTVTLLLVPAALLVVGAAVH
jgi:hypothetical protein